MDAATIARMRMRAQRLWEPRPRHVHDALRWLTAVQSQEFRYARWSLAQRTRCPDAATVDLAFHDGLILRTHVLRPTWHFVARDDLRWLIRLSGPRVNAVNARRYRELGLDAKTLARANDLLAGALVGRHLTRRELAAILERRRISTEGQRLAYILMHAELEAVICSGSMRGKQPTYASFDERVPPAVVLERDEALAELARRFFTARGPATLDDFVWWSGLTTADARGGLETASAGLEQRVVADRAYWFSEDRGRAPVARQIDLVQCYDEAIISYRRSRDVLQTASASFPVPRNLAGFVHVVLCDGRLLGHWRAVHHGSTTAIEVRPARPLDRGERAALAGAVERCRRFLAEPRR